MTDFYQDTIVAPATIPGTGAISIIRVSGLSAFSVVDAVVKLKSGTISGSKGYTVHFGVAGDGLDDVLATVFRAPHSYTGEDMVEVSTHASPYIVSEIVRLLTLAGARGAEPGEFTKRAFLNGKMDLAQAEAVADVISASTSAAHKVAMRQLKGSYSAELDSLRGQLLEMASLLELELDFSEEEVEFADRDKLLELLERTLAHTSALASSFRLGNMIKNGIPVAIVGAANAGKSTLLNALLGEERAIVSSVAGTTRDTIEETLNLGGVLYRIIDTAGIRESDDEIEMIGVQRSYLKIAQASVVIAVIDAAEDESETESFLSSLLKRLDASSQRLIIAVNKCDLAYDDCPKYINKKVTYINKCVSAVDIQVDIIGISAKTKMGLNSLTAAIERSYDIAKIVDEATFVTNERHYNALREAASALNDVRSALGNGLPTELVAEDLRRAVTCLNSILFTYSTSPLSHPSIDSEAILSNIFRNHCIGK